MLEVKAGVVVAPGPSSPSSNAGLQAVAGTVIVTVGQVEATVAVLAVSRVAVVGVGVRCEVVVPAQGLYACMILCNLCIRLFYSRTEWLR